MCNQVDETVKLLPCPFCGGKAENGYYHAYSCDSSFDAIVCTECGVYVSEPENNYKAYKVWNKRASIKMGD